MSENLLQFISSLQDPDAQASADDSTGAAVSAGDQPQILPPDPGQPAQPAAVGYHWQAYCKNGHGLLGEAHRSYDDAEHDGYAHVDDHPQCYGRWEVKQVL